MRLTCPNCSARYEVADSLIPSEGRDVQCSNCATTWFQPGRGAQSPATPSRQAAGQVRKPSPAPAPKAAAAAPAPQRPAAPDPAPSREAQTGEAETETETGAGAAEATGVAQPRRRSIDPELRSILEAEAAREARLRRAEADPVETQAEMPLDGGAEDAPRAELDAAPDAFDMPPAAPGAGAPASARDLFPDIEEINSTLRDTGDRSRHEADASDVETLDTLPRRRRGTRIGFLLVMAIAAGAVAAYVNADRVAATLPELAPAMAAYVTAADGLRFWLDDLARGLAGG